MSEGFQLTVPHNGENHEIEAKFIRLGYIHQFHINLDGKPLIFEFDEERNYRVIDPAGRHAIDQGLVGAIVNALTALHP